jgi:glycosyltransferase involved in cell wall biosynthesis
MKKLSFLIPLFNEEISILPTIHNIVGAARRLNIDFEIIIVDDASSDKSFEVANSLKNSYQMLKVFKNDKNLGFSKTYFNCLKESNSEYVIYISSDNDIDLENLVIILSHLEKAPVILQYCLNQHERFKYRYFISKSFTKIQNILNRKKISYYNGFNIFPSEAVKNLEINESSFAFQSELVSRLTEHYNFIEVGIVCSFNDVKSTAMKTQNILGVMKYLIKKTINSVFC